MEDTFKSAMSQIAIHILNSGIAFSDWDRSRLQESVDKGTVSSIRVDLKGGDTYVTFYVDNALRWDLNESNFVMDEKGNEFFRAKVKVEINYPSHGTCDATTFAQRVEFFGRVAQLAKAIEDEFSGGEYLLFNRTAEEITKAEEAYQEARRTWIFHALIKDHAKGFRVGSKCRVALRESQEVSDGEYTFSLGNKNYSLSVAKGDVTITRIS